MKTIFKLITGVVLGSLHLATANAQSGNSKLPLKFSIFSESVGLPGFKNIFSKSNLGFTIGTEVYYGNKWPRHQVFQSLDLGYYGHKGWDSGFISKTALGYRKFFKGFYPEAQIGIGYARQQAKLARYTSTGNGNFEKASSVVHKALVTVSGGVGYQLPSGTAFFTNYEILGEYFNFQGNPVLPHRVLHTGIRLNLNPKTEAKN